MEQLSYIGKCGGRWRKVEARPVVWSRVVILVFFYQCFNTVASVTGMASDLQKFPKVSIQEVVYEENWGGECGTH